MKEAKLENWVILVNVLTGDKHARGNVYGNPKFVDGLEIVTSPIQKFEKTDGKGKITTKNTIYHLGEELPIDNVEKMSMN